jgi:hypothetical protein
MVQPKAAGPEAATSAGSDLTISRPGDPFEAEADRVADHVVQRRAEPAGPMSSGAGAPALQRACTECSIAAPTEEELATEGDESSGPPAVSPKSRSTDGGAPRRASDEFGSDLRRSRGEHRAAW